MQLSYSISGRTTEYPAAILSDVLVRSPNGRVHSRRWEGVIDTGADLVILPREISSELHLACIPDRVRVWGYRKDEAPRELDVFYVELEPASGLALVAKAILSERRNILIGRAALMKMRLLIDWPANRWSLEAASFPPQGT